MLNRCFVLLASGSLVASIVACSDASSGDGSSEGPGPSSNGPDGSPGTPGNGDTKPVLERAKFDAEMAAAACDTIEPCCVAYGVGFDKSRCRENALKDPGPGASYDGVAAAACVALTRDAAAKCGVTSPGVALDVCGKVFTPTLELGARCTKARECKGGLSVDCLDKECAPRPGAVRTVARGASCGIPGGEFFDVCDTSVDVCDSATSKCVAAPTDGQPCLEWQCRSDLYCDDGDRCRPQKTGGQECDLGRQQCVPGASCVGTFGATCVADADIGQACGEVHCKDFLLCEPRSKTCVVAALGAGTSNCVYP